MFEPKVKLSKDLMDKCKQAADLLGCSSVDEFVTSILEKETDIILAQVDSDKSIDEQADEIKRKLQGLGYID